MTHVQIKSATNQLGLPGQTFDRILVSAAAESFPHELLDQLKPNGTMVIPVNNDIVVIKKTKMVRACNNDSLDSDLYHLFIE